MSRLTFAVGLLSGGAVTAPVLGAALLVARPAQLLWGASAAGVAPAVPGDALSDRTLRELYTRPSAIRCR